LLLAFLLSDSVGSAAVDNPDVKGVPAVLPSMRAFASVTTLQTSLHLLASILCWRSWSCFSAVACVPAVLGSHAIVVILFVA
jgi:hypothetical protein